MEYIKRFINLKFSIIEYFYRIIKFVCFNNLGRRISFNIQQRNLTQDARYFFGPPGYKNGLNNIEKKNKRKNDFIKI